MSAEMQVLLLYETTTHRAVKENVAGFYPAFRFYPD